RQVRRRVHFPQLEHHGWSLQERPGERPDGSEEVVRLARERLLRRPRDLQTVLEPDGGAVGVRLDLSDNARYRDTTTPLAARGQGRTGARRSLRVGRYSTPTH